MDGIIRYAWTKGKDGLRSVQIAREEAPGVLIGKHFWSIQLPSRFYSPKRQVRLSVPRFSPSCAILPQTY